MRAEWSGANGTAVDVYRNGRRLTNTLNDGILGTTISFLGAATYIYKVCEGGTSTCSGTATVQYADGSIPSNAAPVSGFTWSCTDLSCAFTDVSVDLDGSVTGWQWQFGDGSSSNDQNPMHSYLPGGPYTVTLVATDNAGATGSSSKAVTPISASFTPNCPDLTCTFTDSSTPNGSVTGWSWDFGDNIGTSSQQNPTYAYGAEGPYSVKLTATNNNGSTGTSTQTITVTAPPTP
jgi:PKD repeat protein